MRRLACLLLLVTPAARADWTELRAGGDPTRVVTAIGEPLIRTSSRSGLFEAWTYDAGGYAVFIGGRLDHWEVPRQKTVAGKSGQAEAAQSETGGRRVPPARLPVFKAVLVPRRGATAR